MLEVLCVLALIENWAVEYICLATPIPPAVFKHPVVAEVDAQRAYAAERDAQRVEGVAVVRAWRRRDAREAAGLMRRHGAAVRRGVKSSCSCPRVLVGATEPDISATGGNGAGAGAPTVHDGLVT